MPAPAPRSWHGRWSRGSWARPGGASPTPRVRVRSARSCGRRSRPVREAGGWRSSFRSRRHWASGSPEPCSVVRLPGRCCWCWPASTSPGPVAPAGFRRGCRTRSRSAAWPSSGWPRSPRWASTASSRGCPGVRSASSSSGRSASSPSWRWGCSDRSCKPRTEAGRSVDPTGSPPPTRSCSRDPDRRIACCGWAIAWEARSPRPAARPWERRPPAPTPCGSR